MHLRTLIVNCETWKINVITEVNLYLTYIFSAIPYPKLT